MMEFVIYLCSNRFDFCWGYTCNVFSSKSFKPGENLYDVERTLRGCVQFYHWRTKLDSLFLRGFMVHHCTLTLLQTDFTIVLWNESFIIHSRYNLHMHDNASGSFPLTWHPFLRHMLYNVSHTCPLVYFHFPKWESLIMIFFYFSGFFITSLDCLRLLK